MDNNALLKDRLQIIHDAIRMEKKPYRVPHGGAVYGWLYTHDKEPISHIMRDFNLMERNIRSFLETYSFDFIHTHGVLKAFPVTDILGYSSYFVDDKIGGISVNDRPFMEETEYPLFIKDFFKFLWEVVLPRKFEVLNTEEAFKKFYEAAKEGKLIMDKAEYFQKIMTEDYSLAPPLFNTNMRGGAAAIDQLLMLFRGIKGTSIDLRRRSQEISEACAILDAMFIDPLFDETTLTYGSDESMISDYVFGVMAHTLLNQKQFEHYFAPFFKRMSDLLVKYNKTAYYYIEGDFSRFYDYLADIPKGHVLIHLEQDDIFKARKALPNIAISGGMSPTMLRHSTKQDCIDYAKKLIDEIGSEGGFILSQTKGLVYPNDAKPENLKALCDFIREYRY